MRLIRGKISDRQILVNVGVGKFLPDIPGVQSVSPSIEVKFHGYRALIDTGAQVSCLTPKAIFGSGLVSHSRKDVRGGDGIRRYRNYQFHLAFLFENTDVEVGGNLARDFFMLPGVQDAIGIGGNDQFDVIIGMNILAGCDFSFNRLGEFTLQIH